MGVRDIKDRIADTARDVPDRVKDIWEWFTFASWRARTAAVAGVVVVVVAVVVTVAMVGGEDADTDDSQALNPVLVTNTDLPATTWTGWTQKPITDRPAPATPPDGVTAQPNACVPGGQAQVAVQELGVTGSPWAGTEFTNISLQARATAMLARNSLDPVRAIDAWIAQCSHATVVDGDQKISVDLKGLGVNPKTYRLSTARIVSQSVTPQVANADVTSTAITAAGRSNEYQLVVTLTIPGPLTRDAVSTLDTLWRAQAAKLVGYQEAGKLQ